VAFAALRRGLDRARGCPARTRFGVVLAGGRLGPAGVLVRPGSFVCRRTAPRHRRRRGAGRVRSRTRGRRRLVRGHDARKRLDAQHPDKGRVHGLAHSPGLACISDGREPRRGRPRRHDRAKRNAGARRAVRAPRHSFDGRRERLRRSRVAASGKTGAVAAPAASSTRPRHGRHDLHAAGGRSRAARRATATCGGTSCRSDRAGAAGRRRGLARAARRARAWRSHGDTRLRRISAGTHRCFPRPAGVRRFDRRASTRRRTIARRPTLDPGSAGAASGPAAAGGRFSRARSDACSSGDGRAPRSAVFRSGPANGRVATSSLAAVRRVRQGFAIA